MILCTVHEKQIKNFTVTPPEGLSLTPLSKDWPCPRISEKIQRGSRGRSPREKFYDFREYFYITFLYHFFYISKGKFDRTNLIRYKRR